MRYDHTGDYEVTIPVRCKCNSYRDEISEFAVFLIGAHGQEEDITDTLPPAVVKDLERDFIADLRQEAEAHRAELYDLNARDAG